MKTSRIGSTGRSSLSEAARGDRLNVARKTANAIRLACSVLESASGTPVGRRDTAALEKIAKSESVGGTAPMGTMGSWPVDPAGAHQLPAKPHRVGVADEAADPTEGGDHFRLRHAGGTGDLVRRVEVVRRGGAHMWFQASWQNACLPVSAVSR